MTTRKTKAALVAENRELREQLTIYARKLRVLTEEDALSVRGSAGVVLWLQAIHAGVGGVCHEDYTRRHLVALIDTLRAGSKP